MQAGSWGFSLPIQTDEDLTSFTAGTLTIVSPDAANRPSVARSLSASNVVAPPSSGLLTYVVQETDFPDEGLYVLQVTDTSPGRNIVMTPIEIYVRPSV